MTTHPDSTDFDGSDRQFHIELFKGGMNRLLLRSYAGSTHADRIELLFMNVHYVSAGTSFQGLRVRDAGLIDPSDTPWNIADAEALRRYEFESMSGNGYVIAASFTVDRAEAGPLDPSGFFMMD